VRKRSRGILDYSLRPPGDVISTALSADIMEKTLFQYFKDESSRTGTLYLQKLHSVASALKEDVHPATCEIGRTYYIPGLRRIVAEGKLHPADVVLMEQTELHKTLSDLDDA
jgi:hypothetical protein